MSALNLLYVFAAVFTLGVLSAWRIANYAERHQLWTLRLRMSLWQPYVLTSWILCAYTAISIALYNLSPAIILDSNEQGTLSNVLVWLAIGIAFIVSIDLALRALKTRDYLWLRWKAWTGPSRTGIPPAIARYIGNSEDWDSLVAFASNIQQHPVERFAGSFIRSGIVEDPTDLLRARAVLDQKRNFSWSPQSKEMSGVYQPIVSNHSVSILWGEHIGFQRRCSRGIISVPPNLLNARPVLKSGLSGNAICLAYGILARNKGLEPASLICNLGIKDSFRVFEEGGLWPHPAKTLRGFYYRELNQAFSLLGHSYVTAATELALLLADSNPALIGDWLDSNLEHQDLLFNHEVHAMGASQEDLKRIYRGHYGAMLVSLSLYHKGIQIRPEITVFDAVCKLEGAELPFWAVSDAMAARRQRELNTYGPTLQRLVGAVI